MIWHRGVAIFLVLTIGIGAAHADITTERGSSILIFPKVQFDSTGLLTGTPVDTIIQISNTFNSVVYAHCFYVNAAPQDPTQPLGPTNPPWWQEVDFDIFLTKQQPTHWVVSDGRRIQNDPTCSRTFHACSGAGFDPNTVPPVSDPFVGELKCIEVDDTGAPVSGNHLKGEATIVATNNGDASKYNAVGVLGLNTDTFSNNGDNTLCLGGGESSRCPNGPEYNGCPQTVILNHFAAKATDPVIDSVGNGPGPVVTEVTLVPCSEDFEGQAPAQITVQFLMINEFEELLSTSTTVTCWANFTLGGILGSPFPDIDSLGTRFVQTRMSAATDDQPGFVGVVEEFHQQPGGLSSRAALNLHGEGERKNNDVITVPGVIF